MPAVLFVLTSVDTTLTGRQTGWYLPEAAHPYLILSPHCHIDFAAPKGPNPPIDAASIKDFANDKGSVEFWNDPVVQQKLANAKKLTEVNFEDYDAIFFVGGHGPVIDLAFDPVNAQLVSQFWNAGKIVSAVCHGPAALVGAVDASGKSLFAGRTATGFANEEEELLNTVKDVPFLLQDKIIALGGTYERSDVAWGEKVVVDGNLITGQNPGSATLIGHTILKAIQVATEAK